MPRSINHSPLIQLLQAAAANRRDLHLSAFNEAQACWAVERGLGPLLFYTTADDAAAPQSPSWPLLHTTDLTAQVLSGEQIEAMTEIIDACIGRVPPLALLKGISIADQHYPQPYLRPMRDIDFLVDEVDRPAVEAILVRLGYRQRSHQPPEFFADNHHSMPFYHPQRGVWVEVHRRLFSARHRVSTDAVFALSSIKDQLRPGAFRGRRVYRLSDEFQLIYISAHWYSHFRIDDGPLAMLDLIYVLRNTQAYLCWDTMLRWLPGCIAAPQLLLMLTYLQKDQLIDLAPEIRTRLLAHERPLSTLRRRVLHAILDRSAMRGEHVDPHARSRAARYLWKWLGKWILAH